MLATLLPMEAEMRLVHSEKAELPMDVTPLPMVNSFKVAIFLNGESEDE